MPDSEGASRPKVKCVHPDSQFLRLCKDILWGGPSYWIDTFTEPEEVLADLQRGRDKNIALILIADNMPHKSGLDLANEIQRIYQAWNEETPRMVLLTYDLKLYESEPPTGVKVEAITHEERELEELLAKYLPELLTQTSRTEY